MSPAEGSTEDRGFNVVRANVVSDPDEVNVELRADPDGRSTLLLLG